MLKDLTKDENSIQHPGLIATDDLRFIVFVFNTTISAGGLMKIMFQLSKPTLQ